MMRLLLVDEFTKQRGCSYNSTNVKVQVDALAGLLAYPLNRRAMVAYPLNRRAMVAYPLNWRAMVTGPTQT